MPELPEVETIKNDLVKKILRQSIRLIIINQPKLIKGTLRHFKKIILNNSFVSITRVGKLLIFELARENNFLLIHLKMTGQLVYVNKNKIIAGGHSNQVLGLDLPNKYSHIIFEFKDGGKLFFNDLRQFGYLQLVRAKEKDQVVASYGPEPLTAEFTTEYLKNILRNKKIAIKTILLNQKLISGIGNIYADEICFAVGVAPQRPAGQLSVLEIVKLRHSANRIIYRAIQYRGTTFNNYVDAEGRKGSFVRLLKVYGRTGKVCRRCRQGKIRKIKLNGRGTHYCEGCQR